MRKSLFTSAFALFFTSVLFAQGVNKVVFISIDPITEQVSVVKNPITQKDNGGVEAFAAACPTPVFDVTPSKVLNCNSACAVLTVRDSANLTPVGSMTPGWRWTISAIDNGMCSNARVEIWSGGVLRAAVGNNSIGTACGTGCNYLGTWSTFWGTCNTGNSYTVIQEKQSPTATTEIRMYYPNSNASFNWSMNDNFTNAVAVSGAFDFSTVTTGFLTTGVQSKATGINQGTATFVCPTCPVASWTDYQNGYAQFCPAQAVPGKYACTYSFTAGSCSKSYTDTVTVNSINNATWTSPGTICAGASYSLNSYLSGSATPGGTWSGTYVSGSTFTPTGSGTIAVTYSVGTTACKVSQTNTITVLASPTVTVAPPGPVSYCAGTAVNLTLTASGASTFAWNTAQTSSSITVSPVVSTTYTVVGTSLQGCSKTATVSVNFTPLPSVSLSSANPTCYGQTGTVTATVSSGTSPYTYAWSNGNTTSAINATAGTYSVTASDAVGCSASQTATLTQPVAVTGSVSASSTTIFSGTSTNLSASGGSTYLWTPVSGLSCTTCANPVASPTLTTLYCVIVQDLANCADTACVSITVDASCGEFFLPNAFSPNGDSKNDGFKPILQNNCIKDMELKIYNRWGNLVFETTDFTKGWDGSTSKGKDGNEGVYVYDLKATMIDGTMVERKGTVNLLK